MQSEKLIEQKELYKFLLPDNMKILGFDLVEAESEGYYKYVNDGTKHYNKDYNTLFPEPKGKVIIRCNLNYIGEKFTNLPHIGIYQDGDSRTVYNGVCSNEAFLVELLNSVR